MTRALLIRFRPPVDVHRMRNFGEDLSRALRSELKMGVLPMELVDTADEQLRVQNIPARQLSRTRQLVERLLAAHFFTDDAFITPEA